MNKQIPLTLADAMTAFIQDSIKGRRKISATRPVSQGTITNYQYCLKLIRVFENYTGKELSIPLTKRKAGESVAAGHRWWKSFYRHFTQFMLQHMGYSDNYIANNLKTMKAALRYMEREKGWPIADGYLQGSISRQLGQPTVLSPEQMHQLIYDTAFEARLSKPLRRTKDLIVFGCSTGLRISDLQRLRKTAVSYVGDDAYLQCHTQKTGSEIMLALPDYCIAIIRKYARQKGPLLLPALATSNWNMAFKKIGALAGWTWPAPKYRSHKGRMVEMKKPGGGSWKFFDHLSSHTMRRTAITTMLMMGVPETVVRRMSGHAASSREFYRYVAVAQSFMDTQIKQAFKKLQENPSCYRQLAGSS